MGGDNQLSAFRCLDQQIRYVRNYVGMKTQLRLFDRRTSGLRITDTTSRQRNRRLPSESRSAGMGCRRPLSWKNTSTVRPTMVVVMSSMPG